VDFRDRLLATLRATRPVLSEPGVVVVGSEVPNLLSLEAPQALVVSQDVDIGVPVDRHWQVKRRLAEIHGLQPSDEEPSIWIPTAPDLLEVNFLGLDPSISDPAETYVLDDPATDRSGEKGDRDLLVAVALLAGLEDDDRDELTETYATLAPEDRHVVRSNLTVLALLGPHRDMPDPRPHRPAVRALLRVLEGHEDGGR